jgi:hypothetical protein
MIYADPQVVSLEKVMEAATCFGLTDDEVRCVLHEALTVYATDGRATSPDFLDEMTKGLALAILAKHRRLHVRRS